MENQNESIVTAKPRSGIGLLKCLEWGVFILAILVVFGLIWHRGRMASRLKEKLAELDRTEPGWRLEDIEAAREDVPEEENSARVIAAAAKWLPRTWPPPHFPAEPFQLQPPNEKLHNDDFVRLSSELASMRPALDAVIKLADMPRGRYPLPFERNPTDIPMSQINETRKISTLLIYESMRRNQNSDTKDALAACRAALNAARSIGDEPFYISQLVRGLGAVNVCLAIERTLGQAEPSCDDLSALQRILENEDVFPGLFLAARGERAMLHRVFEAVVHGDMSFDELDLILQGRASLDWLQSATTKLGRMNMREDHALFLELTTRRIHEVQLPMHEQAEREKQFQHDVHGLPTSVLISRVSLPSFSKMGDIFRRKHAALRSMIAALAVERFRREKKQWPDSLAHVCPKYLASMPLDPFDGKPLRYRRVEDGVVIYSLGRDAIDSGAILNRGEETTSSVDIGVRLWDVTKRGQPPR
jgi:hypothetical protein